MDYFEQSVVIVDLDAGEGETSHFSTSADTLTLMGNEYYPAPEVQVEPAASTGDFTNAEYKLVNLPTSLDLVAGMSVNLPYSKVAVTIREVFFDMDGVQVKSGYLFRGFVYQCEARRGHGRADLILRDMKYYTDTTAGTPCTEGCSNLFGDDLCQKIVSVENHVVGSINRNLLTIEGPLGDTTPFLFNKGYISMGAQRIDIRYHETGLEFQMDRSVPASWSGQSIIISAGCDRSISTCRDVHNNEEFFRGLGISMVDYNPLYESA